MKRIKLARVLVGTVILGVALTMASCSKPDNPPTPTSTDATMTTPDATGTDTATDFPTAPTPTQVVESNLDHVTATGGFGEVPDITVPAPWAIDATTTKILVQGEGRTVDAKGYVTINYLGINGTTGDKFDDSYSRGAPATFGLTGVVPGFGKGLTGQKVGSRVLIAIPGADGYDAGGGKTDSGINIGDTLVFVVDILGTSFPGPTGETETPADTTLPVVAGELDKPTVSINTTATPPADLVIQPLIKGPGDPVKDTDTLVINYAEYRWDTGALLRQTYGYQPLQGTLSGTIKGWQQGIVGQPAGSRLLLVVPPSLSYPQGYPKIGLPTAQTMVYVIDILYAYDASTPAATDTPTDTPTG